MNNNNINNNNNNFCGAIRRNDRFKSPYKTSTVAEAGSEFDEQEVLEVDVALVM